VLILRTSELVENNLARAVQVAAPFLPDPQRQAGLVLADLFGYGN